MRAFLVTLWAALALGTSAQAQTADPLTCDGTEIGQCKAITAYYTNAIPPFPANPERAGRILATALSEGKSNCRAGDFDKCYKWVNLVQRQARHDQSRMPEQPIILLLQTTAKACAEGNPDGCYWRAQGLKSMGSARPAKPTHQDLMTQAKMLAQSEAETLRPICEDGDALACGRLGVLIDNYDLPKVTPFEHLDFLTKGCVAGSDDACSFLGFAVKGLAQTAPSKPVESPIKAETIANLQNLCDAGRGQICTLLATRILNPKDVQAFLTIVEKACDAGDAIGCSAYGMTQLGEYRETPDPATLTKATEALTKACDQDFMLSCHALQHISQQ